MKHIFILAALFATVAFAQDSPKLPTYREAMTREAMHADIESYKNGLLTATYAGKRYTLKCVSSRYWIGKATEALQGEDACTGLQDHVGDSVPILPIEAYTTEDGPVMYPWVNPGSGWTYHKKGGANGSEEYWTAISIVPVKRAKR